VIGNSMFSCLLIVSYEFDHVYKDNQSIVDSERILSIIILYNCHDLAKWLSHYLYFFSFLFLLSWTYYTEGSAGKCHVTSVIGKKVTVTWQEVTMLHHITSHDRSHDRCGETVHRPCSSYISSVENLMGTLSSSLC